MDVHTVHLMKRTCTCGSWDLTSIPCELAACCIIDKGDAVEDSVDICYRRLAFMSAYKYSMQPVPDPNVLIRSDSLPVSEPKFGPRTGRPKIKRTSKAGGREKWYRKEEWGKEDRGKCYKCRTIIFGV